MKSEVSPTDTVRQNCNYGRIKLATRQKQQVGYENTKTNKNTKTVLMKANTLSKKTTAKNYFTNYTILQMNPLS